MAHALVHYVTARTARAAPSIERQVAEAKIPTQIMMHSQSAIQHQHYGSGCTLCPVPRPTAQATNWLLKWPKIANSE